MCVECRKALRMTVAVIAIDLISNMIECLRPDLWKPEYQHARYAILMLGRICSSLYSFPIPFRAGPLAYVRHVGFYI